MDHYQQKRAILLDLKQRIRPELQAGLDQEVALLDYNLACSLSLAGRLDDCFATLEGAFDGEVVIVEMILADGDLRSLRADSRFAEWLKKLRQRSDRQQPEIRPEYI